MSRLRAPAACWPLMTLLVATSAFADPPPSGKWQPMPELWDEFNGGSLAATHWETRSPYYPGKKPGLYMAHNVEVKGGTLNLWAQAESAPNAPAGYRGYSTAYVTSRQTAQYGYFEVRARPMAARINSAFWLYRWTENGTYEIDVFEIGGTAPRHENAVHTNVHVFKGQPELENDRNRLSDPFAWAAPQRLTDDFHVYGLEWDEQELRFYFDDQLIRRKANTSWHVPMAIRFTVETHPDWFGLPKAGELPGVFQVDYLRAWRRAPGGAQAAAAPR